MHSLRLCVSAALLTFVLTGNALAQARATAALPLDSLSKAFEDISRRVSPSVVQVVVTGYGTPEEEAPSADALLGLRRTGGSGVVLDPNGYIVTNSHVIE